MDAETARWFPALARSLAFHPHLLSLRCSDPSLYMLIAKQHKVECIAAPQPEPDEVLEPATANVEA